MDNLDRSFTFVIFGPIVNIKWHAVVAACLDLVGSVAELPYLVILRKAEAWTESQRHCSTDEILQSYNFAGRIAVAKQSICG